MEKHVFISYDEAEFRTLIYNIVIEALHDYKAGKATIKNNQPIKGIHQLAKFLGVSPSRAQKLKNDGVIPYWQDVRLVFFDPEAVMEVMRLGQKHNMSS